MITFSYILHDQEKQIHIDNLVGYNLSNLHLHRLSYKDEYKYCFNDTHSIYAQFYNTVLRSVHFNHCIFEHCCFDETKFYAGISSRVLMKECSFKKASLRADFYDSCFKICQFLNADFFTSFKNVWLVNNVFVECYFDKTVFENCLFSACVFENCTVNECEFINCDIRENIEQNNQFIKCDNPFSKREK